MSLRLRLLVVVLISVWFPLFAEAQALQPFLFSAAPGVMLDGNGMVRPRQVDDTAQLAAMRARLKAFRDAPQDQKLTYISLPKLFAQVRALREAKKEIPAELRYLGGMTRLQYVFVFSDDKDLVIAGPSESWRAVQAPGDAAEFVVGQRTGRPVMQLDDLIVAMRTAREGDGRVFGCGIYPSPDSLKIADEIERTMSRNTRAQRMEALRQKLGPQDVKIFGTRRDTRLAYICVAADYELKRFAMGLDRAPVPDVGNGVDSSRSAANKFWFEASYEPLLVSKDADAFELRGQRLAVKAGQFDFDPRGATEKAKTFAQKFTKHLPALAAAVPLFAELQNVADEALLANLIRRDRLAEKVGWDTAWVMHETTCPVAAVPVPKTAQTLVGFTNSSLVAGGVMLTLAPCVDDAARKHDPGQSADTPQQQRAKARRAVASNADAIARQP